MRILIDIPQGLKIDFENENWTALTCAEMKNALMNGTVLPKHGRLCDLDAALKCVDDDSMEDCDAKWQAIRLFDWAMSKRVVLEAWGNEE